MAWGCMCVMSGSTGIHHPARQPCQRAVKGPVRGTPTSIQSTSQGYVGRLRSRASVRAWVRRAPKGQAPLPVGGVHVPMDALPSSTTGQKDSTGVLAYGRPLRLGAGRMGDGMGVNGCRSQPVPRANEGRCKTCIDGCRHGIPFFPMCRATPSLMGAWVTGPRAARPNRDRASTRLISVVMGMNQASAKHQAIGSA